MAPARRHFGGMCTSGVTASPRWGHWRAGPPPAASIRQVWSYRLGLMDMPGQSEFLIFLDNRAASKITQGITTEITGEEASAAPRTTAPGN